ncbi:hypothetical protein ACJ2A9_21160 [Anaerobacillus sp. MEB173]|uniref:hypothetical protein n=1 Tax=Anaerobacillus sp. MEB173 TaxID=3383345 RepID=UPI003F8E4F06
MEKVILKRKQVCFNVADDDQKQIFDYVAQKTNFSNYIKRLIERDMLQRQK